MLQLDYIVLCYKWYLLFNLICNILGMEGRGTGRVWQCSKCLYSLRGVAEKTLVVVVICWLDTIDCTPRIVKMSQALVPLVCVYLLDIFVRQILKKNTHRHTHRHI